MASFLDTAGVEIAIDEAKKRGDQRWLKRVEAGDIANLSTLNKSDLVSAINEVNASVDDIADNSDLGLYGVMWDRLTNRLTRLAQAKGITTDTTNFGHFGSVNANYSNPFDSVYPWSEMFVADFDLTKYRSGNYSLKDCVIAAYGDPDFSYKGSNTVFVGRYRPRFWMKSEEDASGNVYIYISQFRRTGYTFVDEAVDGVGLAVDDGQGGVTAGSGVPLADVAVSTIHSRAKSSGFTLQDIGDIDAQIALLLVEYANMNSQQAIGDGCANCYRKNVADTISNVTTSNGKTIFTVSGSALSSLIYPGVQLSFGATSGATTYKGIVETFTVNGPVFTITLDRELTLTAGMYMSVHGFSACEFDLLSDSVGNASGYIGTNGGANAFYRGSMLFANRYQYVLGIYRETGTNHLWICPDGVDPDNYDALNKTVHRDTGIALPNITAAWQTVGGNAQRMPGLTAFMATGATSGSSTSPVGDQQYVPAISAANTILLFGCRASDGWYCGVFGGAWDYAAGASSWGAAGRPILKNPL